MMLLQSESEYKMRSLVESLCECGGTLTLAIETDEEERFAVLHSVPHCVWFAETDVREIVALLASRTDNQA